MLGTILIILLILALLGGLPALPFHSHPYYGWGSSGLLTVILIIAIVMLLGARGP